MDCGNARCQLYLQSLDSHLAPAMFITISNSNMSLFFLERSGSRPHVQHVCNPACFSGRQMPDACFRAFDLVCVQLFERRCGEILCSSTPGQIFDDAAWWALNWIFGPNLMHVLLGHFGILKVPEPRKLISIPLDFKLISDECLGATLWTPRHVGVAWSPCTVAALNM